MDINLLVIAGTVSTIIFALSNVGNTILSIFSTCRPPDMAAAYILSGHDRYLRFEWHFGVKDTAEASMDFSVNSAQ